MLSSYRIHIFIAYLHHISSQRLWQLLRFVFSKTKGRSLKDQASDIMEKRKSAGLLIKNAKLWVCLLTSIVSRDATIQFFQNRSDTANSEDRPSKFFFFFFFFFLCNSEFLYFSVLTRSSLFCVINTIYYSVSQLVGQKCWVCSPKVRCETVLRGSRIVYSQRTNF